MARGIFGQPIEWRQSLLGLLLAPALALPSNAFAQTSSQTDCQFILGFKAFHDLVPTEVGECADNQTFAANGDARQHTSKGLMAWRKADNWTAFTNGYITWINVPNGLESRLNTERFRWEADSASPGTTLVVDTPPPNARLGATAVHSADTQ